MPLYRYTPDELLDKCRQIRDSVTVEEFFRRPEHKKTQELWCAAHFGRGYEQSTRTLRDKARAASVTFTLGH
jgi:hypothetical protein